MLSMAWHVGSPMDAGPLGLLKERNGLSVLVFLHTLYDQAGNGLSLEMGPEWDAGKKRG